MNSPTPTIPMHSSTGPPGLPPLGPLSPRPLDPFFAHVPACRVAGYTHQEIMRTYAMAAGIVGTWGVMLFGPAAGVVLGVAILSAVASDLLISLSTRRTVVGGLWHAGLTGLLLGLTLPATVSWYVPAIGSMIAILCAKALFGGLGHYIWHPALVGRVVLQLFFHSTLSLSGTIPQGPVLDHAHLFFGLLSRARSVDLSTYEGWARTIGDGDTHALLMEPTVSSLRRFADGEINSEGKLRFEPLLRDALPAWHDTLIGAVPGGIGETPTLALLVAGLYLIYRGYLRWQLPVSILAAALVAASVFPISTGQPGGGYRWMPVVATENGIAVGLAYVLYHLTSGELMLGAFLLAGDMIASPKRAQAQVVFGAAIGILTIFMRLYGVVEAECYWSILIVNTLVPFIDRRMKRPVLGMNVEA